MEEYDRNILVNLKMRIDGEYQKQVNFKEFSVYAKFFMSETYFEGTLQLNYMFFCKADDLTEPKDNTNKHAIYDYETKNTKVEENFKKGIDSKKEIQFNKIEDEDNNLETLIELKKKFL